MAGDPPPQPYRADIDGLRAVAVMSVVGYHAFPGWFRGGFTGVDVFFVISGYLISSIILAGLASGNFSFAGFYARRARRLFPALILVLAACYAAGWHLLLPDEFARLGKHIAAGAGFVANLASWAESGYFDRAAVYKPLLHLWSLGIEEQFYLLWPLFLWLAWKFRPSVPWMILAIGGLSFIANIYYARTDAIADFYSPQSRLWELLAGALLAYRSARTVVASSQRFHDIQSLLGAALIGLGVVALTQDVRFPGWWGLLPVGGSMLLIAAGPSGLVNRSLLSSPVAIWIGLISYPLYLWHWPLLSFAHTHEQGVPSAALRVALVALAVLLAWLTYRLVERPIRFGAGPRRFVPGLVLSMIVIGFAGYHAFASGGRPERFPPMVRQIAAFTYDHKTLYREGTCFLRPEQDFAAFASCNDASMLEGAPALLLWGDSHAAHLYPGYRDTFSERFVIMQRTASGCPPIMGLVNPVRPHCRDINDRIFAMMEQRPPERVVLAANWALYEREGLDATISRLRAIGVKSVDLVGPVPQWTDSLPRQLYVRFKADALHRIPERMSSGLKPGFAQLDRTLAAFSRREGARYLSPASILCNEAGCLTRLGDDGASLMAWDDQHLTAAGSRYLVARFHSPAP